MWLSALLQHLPSDPQQFVVAQELNEKATIAAAPIRMRSFFIRVIMTKILDKFFNFAIRNALTKLIFFLQKTSQCTKRIDDFTN
ncbi:MAG TPA: hypothetical protein DCE22_05430 [Verrucomicrobiales bacterium]|nr:hypothetical protein [Verrucomicrobiales bacterium]